MYLVPVPQKLEYTGGKVRFDGFSLKADSEEVERIAKDLDNGGNTSVSFAKVPHQRGEYYTICIGADGVRIGYSDTEAAFRALTTLKQIADQAEDGEVEAVEIEDWPSIKNRGYMLDISRGKIPKIEYLFSLADQMAALKYNELQLYLDSFAVEYKNFPEYVKDTQPLSMDELRRLEAYCAERFIKLVPNQNTFGHMHAWTAHPEIAPLAITGKDGKPSGTLNPLDPGSAEFVDRILDGYFDAFSSDRANVGMDETVELGMNETREECEKRGVGTVYTEYLGRICRLVSEKYRKTPMFWDDIIFKHPEQLANVPENAIVMQWGYETEHHYDRNCRRIRESGRRFYVCPGTSMWGSITGRSNNSLLNITSAAENGAYYGAEGFLLTEWGDDGHPQFPATAQLPFVVGAAASWNCMSHDAESAYWQRTVMLENCKRYLDRAVFKTDDAVSDIVYRMGNFYLTERNFRHNGTELWIMTHHPDRMTPDLVPAFKRVYAYMTGLRGELAACAFDPKAKRQIMCNCDTVIVLARILAFGKTAETAEELDRIIREYRELWLEDNHEKGVEIFIRFLESNK